MARSRSQLGSGAQAFELPAAATTAVLRVHTVGGSTAKPGLRHLAVRSGACKRAEPGREPARGEERLRAGTSPALVNGRENASAGWSGVSAWVKLVSGRDMRSEPPWSPGQFKSRATHRLSDSCRQSRLFATSSSQRSSSLRNERSQFQASCENSGCGGSGAARRDSAYLLPTLLLCITAF